MSNREGVAVRVFEVGDLGVTLERGDALIVGLQPRFVVLLEGDASLGELLYDSLDVLDPQLARVAVDLPACSGER